MAGRTMKEQLAELLARTNAPPQEQLVAERKVAPRPDAVGGTYDKGGFKRPLAFEPPKSSKPYYRPGLPKPRR